MEFGLKILMLITKILEMVTRPIYWYFTRGQRKKVTTPKNSLLKMSATELATKIRKKQLTSEELIRTYIDRIKEVNPIINAVVGERYEDALQDARNVDKYLAKSSMSEQDLEKSKPLLGVPLTIKESCSLQGMPLTGGMLSRVGIKAEADSTIVSRLKASGAIPLLVSNTPEYCLCQETYNCVTGLTRNPYDSTRSAGGSSGGEGALLGAAASIIGLGSDIAGSIRLPAFNNGVFGHKPTPRIANIKGHFPYLADENFPDFLVLGPLTRYATDLRLVMNVIVDPQQKSILRLNEKINFRKLNVFFMEEPGTFILPSVEPEIKRLIRNAVKHLKENCGAVIKNHKFKELKDAIEVCAQTLYDLSIPNPLKGDTSVSCEEIELWKSIFGQSKYSPNLIFNFVQEKIFKIFVSDHSLERAAWKQNFINALGDNGIFLYPTSPYSARKNHTFYFSSSMAACTAIANALGFPATHIPCGLNKQNLPIGIQVIAAPHQDRLCLAIAEEFEKCFGGWVSP